MYVCMSVKLIIWTKYIDLIVILLILVPNNNKYSKVVIFILVFDWTDKCNGVLLSSSIEFKSALK